MKHINDLNQLLTEFSASNFYSVSVQEQKGHNCVCIAFFRNFPTTTAALIIGDALHNLRSALDLLYYKLFDELTGKANLHTHFPIRDEREELVSSINGGLKEKKLADDRAAIALRNFIVDVVKPYETGNWPLWALHDMNITDKHQLLIPVFKVVQFTDISLKDEHGNVFTVGPYYTEDSYWFRIGTEGNLAVREKGHAATAIAFNIGVPVPFQDKPVIPSLTQLAEAVTSTIDAFEGINLRDWRN